MLRLERLPGVGLSSFLFAASASETTFRGPHGRVVDVSTPEQTEIVSGRSSAWIAAVATLVLGAIGLERLLEDASFWVDEAIVAESLRDLPLRELFGPLGAGGNSFPRFYMLFIYGLKTLFGYQTLVLRTIPFLFFLAATYFWLRLLFSRLQAFPLLIGLAFLLNLMPTSWFAYSSMLKQYSFDVFLSVLIFTLPDRIYARCMREEGNFWLRIALTLPCALSYTYALVFWSRLGGWYIGELGRQRYRLSRSGSLGILLLSFFFSVVLWFTDLRFMGDSVFGWWAGCTLGHNWNATGTLLGKFALGWYSGLQEFPIEGGLPKWLLGSFKIVFLIGLFQVVKSIFNRPLRRMPANWGSRSLGAFCLIGALLFASLLIDYPICSGRLTLFVLLPLQILLFEGFVAIHFWLGEYRHLKLPSLALGLAWLLMVAPFATGDALRFVGSHAPDDIRPLLARIDSDNRLSIHVMPCMWQSVRALPGDLSEFEVVYMSPGYSIPWGQEVLVLEKNPNPSLPYCFEASESLKESSNSWQELHGESDPVRLYRAGFPPAAK